MLFHSQHAIRMLHLCSTVYATPYTWTWTEYNPYSGVSLLLYDVYGYTRIFVRTTSSFSIVFCVLNTYCHNEHAFISLHPHICVCVRVCMCVCVCFTLHSFSFSSHTRLHHRVGEMVDVVCCVKTVKCFLLLHTIRITFSFLHHHHHHHLDDVVHIEHTFSVLSPSFSTHFRVVIVVVDVVAVVVILTFHIHFHFECMA